MTRRRVVSWVLVVTVPLLLVVVVATALGIRTVRRGYPEYESVVEVPRLTADVEVVRDSHGIPHIYADTPEDLFRAQAYVHAQDRFWQMDFRRHVTAGRLAELFGEDLIDTDRVVRAMGWERVAREELPLLLPETRRYLDAYADGVNAWLTGRSGSELGVAYALLGLTGGADVPERWAPVHSVSWLKAMAWDLRSNLEDELTRAALSDTLPIERVEQLYPPTSALVSEPIVADQPRWAALPRDIVGVDGEPAPFPKPALDAVGSVSSAMAAVPAMVGFGEGIGSNSWVIGGEHTATGAPLLANDPHLAPSLPSVWYQVGLHCRTVGPACPYDVVGFSFAGLPGVIIGHNRRIAWGFTNMAPDVADVYVERVRGDQYLVDGVWTPMEVREETIEVAGGDDVTIRIRSTKHGPLLSDHDERFAAVGAPDSDGAQRDGAQSGAPPPGGFLLAGDYAAALRWTALEPGQTADALFALNAATDWESFRQAAALFEVPAQNIVYADVDGNIGYQAPGKIPVRRTGDGRYPVPGWNSDSDWVGYIPFDNLPHVFNPEPGYIVAANQAVTGPAYPFWLTGDFDAGHRAGRIQERVSALIESGATIDVGAMVDLQLDTVNPLAELLVPYLAQLEPPEGYYGDGLRLLADWDYRQSPDSAAAAYFNAVWRSLLELTFHDELPPEHRPTGGGRWVEVMRALLERADDPFWDDVETDVVETRDVVLIDAVRSARDDMTRAQGKDASKWSWGRLHALTLEEPSFGTSGIGVVEWLFNRGPFDVGGGSAIVNATSWDASSGFETIAVPSMRMVVDLADFDESRWIDLTGISGHPFHEHYDDQVELWRTGRTLPMLSSEARVRPEHVSTTVLRPAD